MFSLNSKVRDLLEHPVGKDIIHKVMLQADLNPKILDNPVVQNMKLKSLHRLGKRWLGDDFFVKVLKLLNSERDRPLDDVVPIERKWWKEAVFYQIYPRSFKDSDGDGVGDIQGIVSKLDYLKKLGIDALWLSPIYDSPNDDNGYDIRDYRKIMDEFGTMDDFGQLLEELHKRDMRLIMDLVVNHTSDEHEWFQKALEDPESKYHDYYFFKDNIDNQAPNNWVSFFSGPAWKYFEANDEWAMHLFSEKQMDLNWDNPEVRDEVVDMVKWWFDKGVDGFRLDVVNYISKNRGLVDGNEFIGELMEFTGIEEYFYGENLHKYFRELNERAFAPYDAFSVGELPGIGMEMGKLLTGDYRKELDMFFNFDHLETPGHVRFDDYTYDMNYYKTYIMDYQKNYGNHYWMSLFFENHDNPRMISKVNPDPNYRLVLGKMLGVILLTLKGTPFIFQGQELGLMNKRFASMDAIRDVESLNKFNELRHQGMSVSDSFDVILAGTRDHARTPMPWDDSLYAGFSANEPWILDDMDYKEVNVASSIEDETSVYHTYREIIALRKLHSTLVYGDVNFVRETVKDILAYTRKDDAGEFYIEMNLSSNEIAKPESKGPRMKCVYSNYVYETDALRPYEVNIYQVF